MKRIIIMSLILAAVFAGTSFGQDDDFAPSGGWKEQVVVTVSGGKITSINWNGVSNLGVADKKTVAAAGGYGMKKASELGLEWDQQAAKVEAYLVSTQDTAFNQIKADGTTDAISDASLHPTAVSLAVEALKAVRQTKPFENDTSPGPPGLVSLNVAGTDRPGS